jgi:hypothetical protein
MPDVGWNNKDIISVPTHVGRNYYMHEDVQPSIQAFGLTYDLVYARLSPKHVRIWTDYKLRGVTK